MFPLTPRALTRLTATDLSRVAARDRQRLNVERSRVSPAAAEKMTTPTQSIENMLMEREGLVNVLESGWASERQLRIDDYLFALDMRAAPEEGLQEIEGAPPMEIIEVSGQLDSRFLTCTVKEASGPGAGILGDFLQAFARRSPEWLWDRRPRLLP
ncbi:hypothetical protein [Streptomyces sp. NPDC002790]|uniref:hypothetical protein n=1 Tax=Streptomyces sp. NPDC002790 TaxID=3154431 RepID=UPI00333211B3